MLKKNIYSSREWYYCLLLIQIEVKRFTVEVIVSSSHILSLAGQLAFNSLRYRYLKKRTFPGKIEALSLEITHRCICRCIMCNIWKIPNDAKELSMDKWADLLGNPCFSNLVELDITGGEPFLKKDLPLFFDAVKSHKKNNLKRLKSIAVTTNALLTARVLDTTEQILKTLEGSGIQLVLACAMDATDDLHDQIRNYPGAFQKLEKTLSGLMALRSRFPGLILGLKTTILPVNIDQLSSIDQFCRQHNLFGILSPLIITGGRYLNQNCGKKFTFNDSQINQMISFFNRDNLQWSYHARALKDYYRKGKTKKVCSCGLNYAFIRSSGDVHLCPLLSDSAGSILKADFSDIWHSGKARQIRGQVGHTELCSRCTEPGLERYSLYYEGWSYLKLMLEMGPKKFQQFHMYMGLDHYFQKNK